MYQLVTTEALNTSPCGHMRRVITAWAGDPRSLSGQHVELDGSDVLVLEAVAITDRGPDAVGLTITGGTA